MKWVREGTVETIEEGCLQSTESWMVETDGHPFDRSGVLGTVTGQKSSEGLQILRSFCWKAVEGTMDIHDELVHKFLSEKEYNRNVFVMMRYRDHSPFREIEQAIRRTLEKHDLNACLAKDAAFSETLWGNVRVYMDACSYGIAVFEDIDERDFNPNISLELGYMIGKGKRCLLLKEKRMPRLPSDICGFLYRDFDLLDPEASVSQQVETWILKDIPGFRSSRDSILRDIARILSERNPQDGHKRHILLLLHSSEAGYTDLEIGKTLRVEGAADPALVYRDLEDLRNQGVIRRIKGSDAYRYTLTDLGGEAVAKRKDSR